MITERILIEHCSLTLSSLKTASLFAVKFYSKHALNKDVTFWNERFSQSGVKLEILKTGTKSALIYMYRKDMLMNDMNDTLAKDILLRYGYENLNVERAIKKLYKRINVSNEFPHEIGLFLGYPPKDIEGFICNKGENCSLCRYWKVYCDKEESLIKFAKYDKCKEVYKRLWQEGLDIMSLTVKKESVALVFLM